MSPVPTEPSLTGIRIFARHPPHNPYLRRTLRIGPPPPRSAASEAHGRGGPGSVSLTLGTSFSPSIPIAPHASLPSSTPAPPLSELALTTFFLSPALFFALCRRAIRPPRSQESTRSATGALAHPARAFRLCSTDATRAGGAAHPLALARGGGAVSHLHVLLRTRRASQWRGTRAFAHRHRPPASAPRGFYSLAYCFAPLPADSFTDTRRLSATTLPATGVILTRLTRIDAALTRH
ncbi:hypothetical protein C8J57DRAFT_1529950 [Mycena rebaudengoi]|nr:hypothetical protein C8J57DRAFT_1529950 [Mycena rebaudengoi]